MRSLPAVLATLVLLVAGCAGKTDSPAPASLTTAAPAAVTSETGGLEGLVLDDEARPIIGADVGLVNADKLTKSDSGGRFSFSELEPGTYSVVAQRIGYEAATRRVDVVSGEVANLTLALRPIKILEPYHEGPFVFNGYNQLGTGFVDILNQNGAVGCQKCEFHWELNESTEEMVLEIMYKPTLPNPRGTPIMKYQIWDEGTEVNYAIDAWAPRAQLRLNHEEKGPGADAPLPKAKGKYYMINYCDSLYVCMDQKFDVHYTIFHLARAPEDYSALPPE